MDFYEEDGMCLEIVPPEGMEPYINDEELRFRPITVKTYEDLVKTCFLNKKTYYYDHSSKEIKDYVPKDENECSDLINATSKIQVEKIIALNKLLTVARYVNGGWRPCWESNEPFYYLAAGLPVRICRVRNRLNVAPVYFRSKFAAKRAIEILGESTIRLALSTDY